MPESDFIAICKKGIVDYYINHNKKIDEEKIYVVWLCKVLQNNKALLSTPILDGMYFECTYNGDKKELYIDAYSKEQNIVYRWRVYEEKSI